MNARFMGKGVGPDNGLVRLNHDPGDGTDHAAGGVDMLGNDIGADIHLIGSRPDRHDDLFKRGVARPLADAIHGALDLAGPGLNRSQ